VFLSKHRREDHFLGMTSALEITKITKKLGPNSNEFGGLQVGGSDLAGSLLVKNLVMGKWSNFLPIGR